MEARRRGVWIILESTVLGILKTDEDKGDAVEEAIEAEMNGETTTESSNKEDDTRGNVAEWARDRTCPRSSSSRSFGEAIGKENEEESLRMRNSETREE